MLPRQVIAACPSNECDNTMLNLYTCDNNDMSSQFFAKLLGQVGAGSCISSSGCYQHIFYPLNDLLIAHSHLIIII